MDSGYYAACAGLRAQSQALELVANNLANLNTGGYRGQEPTFRSLLATATDSANPLNHAINDFSAIGGSRVDRSPGNLERTGNPMDLAIEGPGFFAIETSNGVLYTRQGGFRVSPEGKLITSQGDAVLGTAGPIAVPRGTVSVSPDGTLSAEGAVFGQVRVVEFPSDTPLKVVGSARFAAPDGSAQPAPDTYVRQGMLESSNVNPMTAVVTLVAVQRHAEMLQRALSIFYSEFNHTATSDLPRV